MSGVMQRLVRPMRLPPRARRVISSCLPSWRAERDALLILRWLVGDLTPREETQVNERLQFDGQFRRDALLLMRVKAMKLDLARRYAADTARLFEETGRPLPVPREQKARAYAAVRAKLGLPPRTMEEFDQNIASYDAMADEMRARGLKPPVPSEEEMAREYQERRTFRMWDRQMRRFRAVFVAGLAVLALYIGSSTLEIRQQGARQIREAVEHRASTAYLNKPSIHDAALNFFDAVTLDGGGEVILSPASRLSVSGSHVALDGHAQVNIPASQPYLMVRTAVASMLLLPGRYDIDAPIGGAPTVISVHAGLARAWGNDAEGSRLVVRAGHEAKVAASIARLVK